MDSRSVDVWDTASILNDTEADNQKPNEVEDDIYLELSSMCLNIADFCGVNTED